MHLQIEMIDGHIGPNVSHLLLASTPKSLHIVELLFERRAISEGFDDFDVRGLWISREEGKRGVFFFD